MRSQFVFGIAAMTIVAAVSAAGAAAGGFTDVTAQAGLVYQQNDGNGPCVYPIFTGCLTGGVAVGDYDNDGWEDLLVGRHHAPMILYRNNGDGTFTDVTALTGDLALPISSFTTPPHTGHYNAPQWGDIDNDGDLDVYVTAWKSSRFLLFVSNGDGTFTEDAVARGVAHDFLGRPVMGQGTAWGDVNGDGFIDLVVSEWAFEPSAIPPEYLELFQLYYDYDEAKPSGNRLFLNLGDASPGHFIDATFWSGFDLDNIPIVTRVFGIHGFAPKIVDLDGDGHQDILFVADHSQTRLFWNNGDGTFVDTTEQSGIVNVGTGMGVTVADYNGDGTLDIFTTAIHSINEYTIDGNSLFLNNGDRDFDDVTDAAGVIAGEWGWAATSLDVDNDSCVDIAHVNGYLDWGEEWLDDRSRLFMNMCDGTFSEQGVVFGITDAGQGRGITWFDYDRDGDQDLFISQHGAEGGILYRNDMNTGHSWLQLDLVGVESGPDAYGAIVKVYPKVQKPDLTRTDFVDGGSNFISQDSAVIHFGLGDAKKLERVEILWPSGNTQVLGLPLNRRIKVVESPCGQATNARLSLKSVPERPSKNALRFTFQMKGVDVEPGLFGNPAAGTSYTVGLYSIEGEEILETHVPPGPLWSEKDPGLSYSYRNRESANGVNRMKLSASDSGSGRVSMSIAAKGESLALPPDLTTFGPEVIFRVTIEGGLGCAEARFAVPKKHKANQYDAKVRVK